MIAHRLDNFAGGRVPDDYFPPVVSCRDLLAVGAQCQANQKFRRRLGIACGKEISDCSAAVSIPNDDMPLLLSSRKCRR